MAVLLGNRWVVFDQRRLPKKPRVNLSMDNLRLRPSRASWPQSESFVKNKRQAGQQWYHQRIEERQLEKKLTSRKCERSREIIVQRSAVSPVPSETYKSNTFFIGLIIKSEISSIIISSGLDLLLDNSTSRPSCCYQCKCNDSLKTSTPIRWSCSCETKAHTEKDHLLATQPSAMSWIALQMVGSWPRSHAQVHRMPD